MRHYLENGTSPEEAFLGNRHWFKYIISDKPLTGLMTRYKNRFNEMLKFCNRTDLSLVAFTNINLDGGGRAASPKYWKMDKFPILNDIIAAVKPSIVFTTKELFNIVSKDTETQSGIEYSDGKVLRSVMIQETVYYEIDHPCYSKRIKV